MFDFTSRENIIVWSYNLAKQIYTFISLYNHKSILISGHKYET